MQTQMRKIDVICYLAPDTAILVIKFLLLHIPIRIQMLIVGGARGHHEHQLRVSASNMRTINQHRPLLLACMIASVPCVFASTYTNIVLYQRQLEHRLS